jgi:diketogulonate reductase-like aldo/keto reductase
VRRACEGSLKRLGTSYLDLYLAHAFSDTVPLAETMRAMDRLVDEGLVRAIGVSNFSPKHVAEAQALSHHKIVCNQVHYSLSTREPERAGLLDYCQVNDVFLVAYRPIEKGHIAAHPPNVLKEIAVKYQKTPTQIALNWLFSQKNVVAIVMSRSAEHLKENIGAVGWHLSDEDIEALRNAFPNQRDVSDAAPLE